MWLLRLFLIALVLQSPWLASSLFTAASNRHRNLSYSYAGTAVLSVAAMAGLIPVCGLLAVPIGMILGDAIACYHFVIKDTCNILDEGYARFAARLWLGGPLRRLVLPGASVTWGISSPSARVPFRWLQVGALTTLAAALTSWQLGLRKDDRSRVASWGRSRALLCFVLGRLFKLRSKHMLAETGQQVRSVGFDLALITTIQGMFVGR